jgi:competence protein ComEC
MLVPADWLLDWLMLGVEFAAGGGSVLSGGARVTQLVVSLLAAAFLCCRMPWRWRVMSGIAWMAWATPVATEVPPGEFRVTALDVGQGSALLIDTSGHRLLFDAGPEYPGGFNLGAAVVLPSLLRTGPPRLDAVVLSHQDLDHTGGMSALRENIPIDAVYSSFALPQQLQSGSQSGCQKGISWVWDDVTFRFLTPAPASRSSDNDRSCVLHVAARSQAALFSGDISSRIERRLVRESGVELDATVLTAPHHGSNGSSSRRWIDAARPRLVLISAPRRSRYGHPHPAVIARYRSAGARWAVTGRTGALVWNSWQPEQLFGWRLGNTAYWINQY